MYKPVSSTSKYFELGSYDAVAKALIEENPENDWALQPRSLSAKIGQLDKGELSWWITRPKIAECLAEFLSMSLEDLGLHEKAESSSFSFTEFPEFPPLDFKHEKQCALASGILDAKQVIRQPGKDTLDCWLEIAPPRVMRPPYSMDWLYVPDDLELQLLIKRLKVTSPYEVIVTENLSDAADRLKTQKPLIVSVRNDGGEEDLAALAGRPHDVGILIIAPFMLPVRTEISSAEFMCWEMMTSHGLEREKLSLTAPGFIAGEMLKRWTWTTLPDWRYKLLEWVDERLKKNNTDTIFDLQGIKNWLKTFDPRVEWFSTVSNIMQLCRIAHHNNPKKLPEQSEPEAGRKFIQLLYKNESPVLSLRLMQLAEARWNRRDINWKEDLPLKTWMSLSISGTVNVSRTDLKSIVQGQTRAERETAADSVANMLELGNPDTLINSGLIKQNSYDHYDFQHRTLAVLLTRDMLMRLITQEPLESWALFCFDPQRRPVVDAALDAVPIASLVDATEKLAVEANDSAVAIGASEALFTAVGRRIANGETLDKFENTLMPVARIVFERLQISDYPELLPQPLSRPMDSQDEKLEWISSCWSWSLLPNPNGDFLNTWLFPGWCKSLPKTPFWLKNLWPDEEIKQISTAWSNLFKVVDEWVKDLEDPLPEAPCLLRIAFLAKAARGGWPADPAWHQDIISTRWAEDILLIRLKEAGKNAAALLWKPYLEFEQLAPADKRFLITYSRVRIWLLERLDPDNALNCISEEARCYLASIPETLPPAFRNPLLQSLADNPFVSSVDPHAFFKHFGPSALPALKSYLDHIGMSWAAAECMWRWSPKDTERLLRHRESISTEARAVLLETCPASYIATAIDILTAEPTLLATSERLSWVKKYLTSAGCETERLVEIMKSTQKFTLPTNDR